MLFEPQPPTEPPSPDDRLPKWQISIGDFCIFIALLFASIVVGSSLGASVARALALIPDSGDPPLLAMLVQYLGMQLGLGGAYWIFRRFVVSEATTQRASPPTAGKNPIAVAIKWFLIACVVVFFVGIAWQWTLTSLGVEPELQESVKLVKQGGTLLERTFLYALIVLVAPVCEEFAFRAGIFRYLHHRMPLAVAGSLSALVFALVHLNLYSFLPLMVLGVMLALAYRESGNVLSSILIHAAFNATSLVLILSAPEAVT